MGFFDAISNVVSAITPWNDDSTFGQIANVGLGVVGGAAGLGALGIGSSGATGLAGALSGVGNIGANVAGAFGSTGSSLSGALGMGSAGAAGEAAIQAGLSRGLSLGDAIASATSASPSLFSGIGAGQLLQAGLGLASYTSAGSQAEAAQKSAQAAQSAQLEGTRLGIDEMRRQFDASRATQQPFVAAGTEAIAGMQPYQQAGQQAFQGQQNLLGMGAPGAQQAAIDQIAQSPQFTSMVQQGENAMLQNASATGGLRGGNVQGALAQFRPELLSQLINQQYSRLGGISGAGLQSNTNLAQLGQGAAAQQAASGLQTGQGIAGLYETQGTAESNLAYLQGGIQNAQSRKQMESLTGLGNMFAKQFGIQGGF